MSLLTFPYIQFIVMQFKLATIVAALALAAPAVQAVEISFYIGRDCHGANLGHSSVHETNHRYNCPVNTGSMVISDNGLNRNIVITGGGSGSHRGNGCFSPVSCTTYELRA